MNHFAVFIFLNSISSSIGLYNAPYASRHIYENYENSVPNHRVEYLIGDYGTPRYSNRPVPDWETENAYIHGLDLPIGSSYHPSYKNGRPHYDYAFHNNAHHNHHDNYHSRPNPNRGTYYP